jgi:hypothetical protein
MSRCGQNRTDYRARTAKGDKWQWAKRPVEGTPDMRNYSRPRSRDIAPAIRLFVPPTLFDRGRTGARRG